MSDINSKNYCLRNHLVYTILLDVMVDTWIIKMFEIVKDYIY